MKKYFLAFFMVLVFIGCVSTNQEGLTLSISPQTMQNNIAKEFPIKKDLAIGKLALQNPQVGLKEGSDKVQTIMTFVYTPPIPLIPEQTGTIDLSGKILYSKENTSFYLQEPELNKLTFNNQALEKYLPHNFKMILGSIANEVFKQYPVYKLSQNTLSGKLLQSIVKKAEVKNGALEVTFGMPGAK